MNKHIPYQRSIRYLHWGMALAYLMMFTTAIAWNVNENLRFLMNPHRAIGVLLLILSLLRVMLAIKHAKQSPPNSFIARLGHAALYFFMITVPASGLIRQIGSIQEKAAWIDIGDTWHGLLAWIFLVFVIGHIAMVIIHQRKGDVILNRMSLKTLS